MAVSIRRQSNKFQSKLLDRKCKNKHRDGQYRDVGFSNRCVNWDHWKHKIMDDIQNEIVFNEEYNDTKVPVWQCPTCTYINIERLSFCAMCNQPLNFNFYDQKCVNNQPLSIKYIDNNNNNRKNKKKSKKVSTKHTFESYWDSLSEFREEYKKAVVKNKNKQRRHRRKMRQLMNNKPQEPTIIIVGNINKNDKCNKPTPKKFVGNIKLNVTLRFKTVRNSRDHSLAIRAYNIRNPRNRICHQDYKLLDCIVSMKNIQENSIIRCIKLTPDIKDCYIPIFTSECGRAIIQELPIVNQTRQLTKGWTNVDRPGAPIGKYKKMSNFQVALIAAQSLKDSFKNIRFAALKYGKCHNGSYWRPAPIPFDKYALAKILFDYIPQMDVLFNVLIPFVGDGFFYYIQMESYAMNDDFIDIESDGDNDDNKTLSLDSIRCGEVEFIKPLDIFEDRWGYKCVKDKYKHYPTRWFKEGYKTRGVGKNRWAWQYVDYYKNQPGYTKEDLKSPFQRRWRAGWHRY